MRAKSPDFHGKQQGNSNHDPKLEAQHSTNGSHCNGHIVKNCPQHPKQRYTNARKHEPEKEGIRVLVRIVRQAVRQTSNSTKTSLAWRTASPADEL